MPLFGYGAQAVLGPADESCSSAIGRKHLIIPERINFAWSASSLLMERPSNLLNKI